MRREGTKGNYTYIYKEIGKGSASETKIDFVKVSHEQKEVSNRVDNFISKLKQPKGVKINQDNFYQNTVANWKEVKKVDFKPNFKSDSGSQYMYGDGGVYRKSNHFVSFIASCSWLLNGEYCNDTKIAFCKFEDFRTFHQDDENKTSEQNRDDRIRKQGELKIDIEKKAFRDPNQRDLKVGDLFQIAGSPRLHKIVSVDKKNNSVKTDEDFELPITNGLILYKPKYSNDTLTDF